MPELRTLLDARIAAAMTADVNNYATGDDLFVVLNNSDGAINSLTGLSATSQDTGCVRTLINRGSSSINLPAESASSSAANRFAWAASIPAYGKVVAVYSESDRWEVF